MSNVSEAAEVMKIRVLKWNEKLENNVHQRYTKHGFFVFIIANEFIINGHDLVSEGMTEKVMLFDLKSLLSPQKIESMVRNMLGLLSIQFLSETMTSLGTKISNYLSTRFEFKLDIRASMSVIVVEVYRTRNIVYDQEIIGDVAALFPPETAPFYEETIYKNFGCEYADKVACSIRDAIGIEAKPDDDDFASLVLKHAYADNIECTTRDPIVKVPIVDDEPIGLFQISAVVAMQIEGDFEKVNSSCPICLGDSSNHYHKMKSPCSHIFHMKCITQWLSRNNYCPLCKCTLPVVLSFLF